MTVAAILDRLEDAGVRLEENTVAERAAVLGSVGARFTDPDDPLAREALERLPEESGFSTPMARYVLERMAPDWTPERVEELLHREFPNPAVLDGFAAVDGRTVRARPSGLTVQFVGGAVPGVGVNAMIRSLLVGSPTLLRPGGGDTLLPRLFLRGLADLDEGMGAACAVERWASDDRAATEEALRRAGTVVLYGGDEVVRDLRARCPATTRVVAYHHRSGMAVVCRGALTAARAGRTAADLARAVATFDQRGCVCPAVAFVESDDDGEVERFAESVAAALDGVAEELPAGPVDPRVAALLAQLTATWELLEAEAALVSPEFRYFPAREPTAGAVLVDPTGSVHPPGAGRVLVMRPFREVDHLTESLRPFERHLQTVGLAAGGEGSHQVFDAIAAAGASRIVPISDMAFPPPWWLHDGRGPLSELVTWSETRLEI